MWHNGEVFVDIYFFHLFFFHLESTAIADTIELRVMRDLLKAIITLGNMRITIDQRPMEERVSRVRVLCDRKFTESRA